MISQQLSVIFSTLYGPRPLPLLKDIRAQHSPIIESSYVNSPDMADVSFIVENKSFYAHRIILASASQRFKTILANFKSVTMPEIEIRDIDYQTFEVRGPTVCLKWNEFNFCLDYKLTSLIFGQWRDFINANCR